MSDSERAPSLALSILELVTLQLDTSLEDNQRNHHAGILLW